MEVSTDYAALRARASATLSALVALADWVNAVEAQLDDTVAGATAALTRLHAAGQTALPNLDPDLHAAALKAAIQDRIKAMEDDAVAILAAARGLPDRIADITSDRTLSLVRERMDQITVLATDRLDATITEFGQSVVQGALVAPLDAIVTTVTDLRAQIEGAVDGTRQRLEDMADTLDEAADAVVTTGEELVEELAETWENRGETLVEKVDAHRLNIGQRAEILRARFDRLQDRAEALFGSLSEMRQSLSDLTEENSGPAGDLAAAMQVATDTFNSVV